MNGYIVFKTSHQNFSSTYHSYLAFAKMKMRDVYPTVKYILVSELNMHQSLNYRGFCLSYSCRVKLEVRKAITTPSLFGLSVAASLNSLLSNGNCHFVVCQLRNRNSGLSSRLSVAKVEF